MPTVPRKQSLEVKEQGFGGMGFQAQAPLSAFGGGQAAARVNESLAGLVSAIGEVEDKRRSEADQLNIQNAETQAAELSTRLQVEATNKVGRDAFASPEYVKTEWEKGLQDIEKTLVNDNQKREFQKSSARTRMMLDRQVQFHVADQRRAVDDQETKAFIQASRDQAVLNSTDDLFVKDQVRKIRTRVDEWAVRNGVTDSVIKENKVRDEVSATHRQVVGARLNAGRDQLAKEYFEANKADFNAEDLTYVEKIVKDGSVRGESQRQASEIMLKRPGDMKAALREAREIKDADVQNATVQEIKIRFEENRQAVRQAEEDSFKVAADLVEKNKSREKVPEQVWNRMSLEGRAAIERRIEQLRRGVSPVTDWTKYYDMKTMASSSATRDQFLRQNLGELRPDLADSEFKELIDLQTGLRQKDEAAMTKIEGFRTNEQILNGTFRANGFDLGSKSKDDLQKIERIRRVVDEQVRTWERANKKDIPSEEFQNIVDKVFIKGVTDEGMLWDTTNYFGLLEEGQSFAIRSSDIPVKERTKVEAALRSAGIAVTDKNVINLFNAKHQLGSKKSGTQ